MSATMQAIRKLSREPGLQVVDVPLPEVASHDVLVAVEAASICGTDLHIWKWDQWSQNRIKPPLTIGHEMAGTVIEVGGAVEHLKVGDFVSAESHVTCGMCFQCRTGQGHMCPNTKILGVDRDGVFAEYVSVPEKVVWQNDRRKIPPEIATLQEPFGNAVYATLAHDLAGQSVAVLGCGPIGLFAIAIAKASGAASVFAVDVIDFRLQLAKAMGADALIKPGADGDPSRQLIAANEGYGVDIILEMSGAPAAVNAAFSAVRNGGRVTLFGIPASPVCIDVAEKMIFKNLTVLALNGRRIFDSWYKTRWLLEQHVVNLRPLVTREMPFAQIDEAMRILAAGQACKIVLRPPRRIEAPPSQRDEAHVDAQVDGLRLHP